MSDSPVSWTELEEFCSKRQHQCHALMDQKTETHALRIESERRKGYGELAAKVDILATKLTTIEEALSSRAVWVLPRPILYLLCAGMAGLGAAGKELGALFLSWFGIKVGG